MNLVIFLSDRCNMACGYCFLKLNEGRAVVLGEEAARRAVGDHAERFGKEARFAVLGGEPFLHWTRLRQLAQWARRTTGEPGRLRVVTNGTLACPEKLSELSELGARVTVSLDGRAEDHDRARPFVRAKDSTLETALLALESVDKSALTAHMVLDERSAGSLLANLEFLRAAGFSRLAFHPQVLERWTPRGLAALERSLAALPRYLAAARRVELTNISSYAAPSPDAHGYDDVVLGADGRYYPCDGVLRLSYAKAAAWAVGETRKGVDWKARRAAHEKAEAAIHAVLRGKPHYSCPREAYFHSVAAGEDAAPAVRSFAAADALMGAALSALAAREGAHA